MRVRRIRKAILSILVPILVSVLASVLLTRAQAQQAADDQADTTVQNPAFQQNAGPVVAIDSGHNNFHTAQGRYLPFANLLRHDGLRVIDKPGDFSAQALGETRLLVVANALSKSSAADWKASPSSAFTPAEIDALVAWVRQGGSLLLIADHRPFAGNADGLALAFGFRFSDGVARLENPRRDIFTVSSGTLKDDEILAGRNDGEKVTSVETFTGSAFQIPPEAQLVIVLPHGYSVYSCGLPCPADAPKKATDGLHQGAVLRFGRGKLAVFGEAAMFSAQTIKMSNGKPFYFGFNAPTAGQNKQFILNLVRWLVSAPTQMSH